MSQDPDRPAATARMGNGALYGIVSAEELVAITGVHIGTARRWKQQARTRLWLARLVRLCVEGQLGDISREWDGWRIRGKHLVSPEGWAFTFGEIRSIPFLHAQVREYQRLQSSVQQADWIDERYVEPADLEAPIAGRFEK